MRSVPQAIFWHLLRRGYVSFLLAALITYGLPVTIFGVLRHSGALDPADQSSIIMHVVLIQMNVFIFGIFAIQALGPPSRLYTYPVSNAALVAWQMAGVMAVVWLGLVAGTALLNATFDLGWPLWGPALFGAVSVAALQAVLWLMDKSGWVIVALCPVLGGLALWLETRYGPMFTQPNHYWTELTAGEVATLVVATIPIYIAGIFGFARNRRGEPPYSVGLIAWLERVFSLSPEARLPFRTPLEAQLWCEWRQKGWAMPAIVGMGLFMGLAVWLPDRKANTLFEGLVAGGGLLSLGGLMSGIILGNVGPGEASSLQIAQFLATRPLATVDLARTVLKNMTKSVVLAWTIWAAAFLLLALILWTFHIHVRMPPELHWWFFPLTLLGVWTGAGLLSSLALTGRMTLLATSVFAAISLFVGLVVFSQNVLPLAAQEPFREGLAAFCGVVFVLGTIGAFAVARRRTLVGWPTLCAALAVWILLCIAAALVWTPGTLERVTIYLLLIGGFALAVAPLATAPLALAWNRTR